MRPLRILRVFLLTFLLLGILLSAILIYDGLSDELETVDLAIVFGNTVAPDGTPSPRLQTRLDRAVELYRQTIVPAILVSGGIGQEGVDEAAVMQQYLIEQGIPGERIFVDHAGIDTHTTALHTANLMQAHGWERAVVVTQYFHIARAKLALRQAGVETVDGAHARYTEPRDLYSIPRELLGIGAYILRYGW